MISRVRLKDEARRRPSEIFRKARALPRFSRASRASDMTLIVVFLMMICLPLAGLVLGLDRSFLLEENRNLAVQPELKLDRATLGALPGRFEAYFNDHFGFRKRLIQWLALVKVKGLGVSSTPMVTLGSSGWLYFGSESAVSSYRSAHPFSSEQLEQYRRLLEARRDWLAARGIRYLVIIPPNKDTVYPEFVPPSYNKLRSRSRLDQLLDYMNERSSVLILDIRDDLRRAKSVERVYDITDSHWNPRGAYVAYVRIMRAISEWFPEARVCPRSEFHDVVETGPGGDLARMLGIADSLPEAHLSLVPCEGWHFKHTDEAWDCMQRRGPTMGTKNVEALLTRLVLFRDSFAGYLIPFLAEHFQRTVCIWDRNFDRTVVERERPALVITEFVERALEWELPDDHQRTGRE
jgi:alginate O-acetyltransferase complex protein AlgJ